MLISAIAFLVKDNPYAVHIAMILTMWTSVCKIIRGQVMKLRNLDFVTAARLLGAPDRTIILRHIIPNLMPILLIEATLIFVTAIKTEAILSFLGLGSRGGVTWGIMLSESSAEATAGILNNFLAASCSMSGLVVAFNFLAESLQKHISLQDNYHV